MCGVGALAGASLLRHGVIKERLWRRGVQPDVSRDLARLLALPMYAILAAAGLMS